MTYIRKTSDIIISPELGEILTLIKDKSEVAKLLLKQRHSLDDLINDTVNYLSISESDNTKISYLTQDRVVSIIDSGQDIWKSPKRFHIKPGGIVSKIFNKISPQEIEKFSTLFRNVQSKLNLNFEIVSGESIRHFYKQDSYSSDRGSLGSSCMKYQNCQKFLGLYVDNPRIIKMLVVTDKENKLVGRALLWHLDGIKVMDRIYTTNDENYQYFLKKWADDNQYWYKKEQKWNNTLFFESNGKVDYKELKVKLEFTDFEYYPYMDTFKFIDFENNTLYNYQPPQTSYKTLCSAEGNIQAYDVFKICDKTKTFHSCDNINYVPNRRMSVNSELTVYSEIHNVFILREDAEYDSNMADWIYSDDTLNNQILIEKIKNDMLKLPSEFEILNLS